VIPQNDAYTAEKGQIWLETNERRLKMKVLSCVLAVIGVFLFVYAEIFRFISDPTVFGNIYPLEADTVVLGANGILLMAILAHLYNKK
jgi:hypothetical protein